LGIGQGLAEDYDIAFLARPVTVGGGVKPLLQPNATTKSPASAGGLKFT